MEQAIMRADEVTEVIVGSETKLGKTAVLTGASRGIGKAAANRILSQRADYEAIVLVARDSAYFNATVEELRKAYPHKSVHKCPADLSDPASVDTVYAYLAEHDLEANAIINNAGYTNPKSINAVKIGDFEHTLRTNLISPFRMVQAAIEADHELELVINVASTAGMNGRAGWLTYSASKAAVINMSEVMREELSPYDVNVVCISPGRCATDLRKTLAPDEDPKTIMQPSQVGDIIAFLMSPEGRLIDSKNIVVRT